MSELTLIPDAIRYLEGRLRGEPDLAGLAQVLRALQRMGLRRVDLQVRIEKIRAVNAITDVDANLEANCLTALDIVTGLAGDLSLRWDSGEVARLLLPKVIDQAAIEEGLDAALSRSDMLPPRAKAVELSAVKEALPRQLMAELQNFGVEPQRADFFRVPKDRLTTRPAALLAPQDRMCWEALASEITELLDRNSPDRVLWPRDRTLVSHSDFTKRPLSWECSHVVRTDIESYYDGIDHALLALSLGSTLRTTSTYTRAVEAFLDTIMGTTVGIPQGPPGSEIFASCFLLLVDQQLISAGISFVRYMDDYLIEADSMLDGRRKIELLESLLRDVGLRLNGAKTKVLKRSTYIENAGATVSARVLALRARLEAIAEERIRTSEDPADVEEQLRNLGAEEQTLFDFLYHGTSTIDDVIEEIRDQLSPTLAQSYAIFVQEEAEKLRHGDYPADDRTSAADLEESFLSLASARVWIEVADTTAVLNWHSSLSPAIAAYARNLSDTEPSGTRDLLHGWLETGANTDWVQSWGCSVAENSPNLVDSSLANLLEQVAQSNVAGPLTRAGAARALAAARNLRAPVWAAVLDSSSAAMSAELFLDSASDPDAYPEAELNLSERRRPPEID